MRPTAAPSDLPRLMQAQQRRQRWLLALLALAALAAFLLNLCLGSLPIPLADWWQGLSPLQSQIIGSLRLPRALLALQVGAGLAVCGVVLQVLFHNPVAEPGLVGISGGASLLAVAAIFVAMQWGLPLPPWGTSLAAFCGSLLVTAGLLWLSRRAGLIGARLLLLGVAVGILSGALTTWLLYFSDDQSLRAIMFWMMGSLAYGQAQPGYWWLPYLLCLGWLLSQHRQLALLQLGELQAQLLGLELAPVRRRFILAVALLSGMTVALAGLIGFIGLVVPHLLRLLGRGEPAFLLPASALGGGGLLLLADLLSRSLLPSGELPVGVVTATLGAPLFIYLLVRRHAEPV